MGLFDDIQGTKKTRAAGRSDIVHTDARATKNKGKGSRAGKTTIKEKEKHIREKKPDAGGDILAAGGVPVDMLPASVDDVGRLLPAWVAEWIEHNNIKDIRKESPQVFRSLCLYIGRTYIKASGILKDTTRTAAGACVGSTCNRYDPAAVLALWDFYENMCAVCGQIPFQTDYAAFCGVSIFYIRDYVQRLTSSGVNLAQKTHDAEMDALRRTASRDPVGRLAILNNELWNGGGVASSDSGKVAESIPTAAAFGLIETAKIE